MDERMVTTMRRIVLGDHYNVSQQDRLDLNRLLSINPEIRLAEQGPPLPPHGYDPICDPIDDLILQGLNVKEWESLAVLSPDLSSPYSAYSQPGQSPMSKYQASQQVSGSLNPYGFPPNMGLLPMINQPYSSDESKLDEYDSNDISSTSHIYNHHLQGPQQRQMTDSELHLDPTCCARVPSVQDSPSLQQRGAEPFHLTTRKTSGAHPSVQDIRSTTADTSVLLPWPSPRGENDQSFQYHMPGANAKTNRRETGAIGFWSADLPFRLDSQDHNTQGGGNTRPVFPDAEVSRNQRHGKRGNRHRRGGEHGRESMGDWKKRE
jgi:hypothetical protein